MWVKLLGFDDRGKVRLSMKIVDQATGKEIPRAEGEPEEETSRAPAPPRPRRPSAPARVRVQAAFAIPKSKLMQERVASAALFCWFGVEHLPAADDATSQHAGRANVTTEVARVARYTLRPSR